ncbi:MAG: bifunctional diguanylate cyclase/phosphodiesterase, partial [Steroidobacteraceae bacterium]
GFHEELSRHLDSSASHTLVCLLDIHGFTRINNTLGKTVGDTLLKTVGDRLASKLPPPHIVARISAATFAVAMSEVGPHRDALAVVNEFVLGAFCERIVIEAHELQLTAKVGAAVHALDGHDAATLLQCAEVALSHAQHSGESIVLYTAAFRNEAAARLALEVELRRAIEQGQFELHYQPKVFTHGGRVAGLEALLRWNHPRCGLLSPDKFIAPLEETGLILQVGQWAIEQALRDHQRWTNEGLVPPRVAVNVSTLQLSQPGFVDVVRSAIRASGAAPDALELEMTESLIIENIEANARALQEISDLGVFIAIDDFGTGYSSLRYLAKLPVDHLKIDRSFIATMVSDPDSMTIVSTVISLAHALDLEVVAEGVETEEQARLLKLMRCDEMQGFLFSKPLPRDACGKFLFERSEMMMTGAFRRQRFSAT